MLTKQQWATLLRLGYSVASRPNHTYSLNGNTFKSNSYPTAVYEGHFTDWRFKDDRPSQWNNNAH